MLLSNSLKWLVLMLSVAALANHLVYGDLPLDPDMARAGPLIWLALAAIALSVIAGLLLPKPSSDRFDDRPPQLAKRGDQLAYVLGRRLVTMKPMWVGRRAPREESSGGGKKGGLFGGGPKQTIWYESSAHAVCLGPASRLHRILKGAEEVVFQGPVTPNDTPSGTILQDTEGNQFRIYWGEESQPINTSLAASDALGIASRWPYWCYIEWIDRRLGVSATWPQLSYDIESTCVGVLPLADSDCEVLPTVPSSGVGDSYDPGSQDGGINAAHALFQLLTGQYPHGGGISSSELDWGSLKALGSLIQTEALAHNISIIDNNPLQRVVAEILADSSVFLLEEQGKVVFKSLRDGDTEVSLIDALVLEPLPSLNIEQGGYTDDRIVFLYPDVLQFFTDNDIVTDDDSTALAMRRKKTREVRMPFLTHARSAVPVSDRRKQLLIADGNEVKFKVNKTMKKLVPGHLADLAGVGKLRITAITRETTGGSASVTAAIDQYTLVSSDWAPDLPPPPPPLTQGGPDTVVRVLEAPRKFVGEVLALVVVRGRTEADGTPASVYTSTSGTSYTLAGSEPSVAAYGVLSEDWFVRPVGYDYFKLVNATGPSVLFSSSNASRLIDLSGEDPDWRADKQIMLLQDEIMSVRRFTAVGGGLYSPEDVVREQLFTQHQQHNASSDIKALVFDPSNLTTFSRATWSIGTTVFVKVVPDGVAIDDVTAIEITLTGKALGALPVDNIAPLEYTSGNIDFTWGFRLNLGTGAASGELPAGQSIPADPGDEGDYEIKIYDAVGNLERTTLVTGTSWTYTTGMQSTDGTNGNDFDIEITARAGAIGGYPVRKGVRNI